jgi:hypothetical protein
MKNKDVYYPSIFSMKFALSLFFAVFPILGSQSFFSFSNTSQTKIPFYILNSKPQIFRGSMENWQITRFGHASKGKENTRINKEIKRSLSRGRITVSFKYVPSKSILL